MYMGSMEFEVEQQKIILPEVVHLAALDTAREVQRVQI